MNTHTHTHAHTHARAHHPSCTKSLSPSKEKVDNRNRTNDLKFCEVLTGHGSTFVLTVLTEAKYINNFAVS
jgi:hypothetical protein